MEYHPEENELKRDDHEQYCNYPEFSKSFKNIMFDEEEQNCDDSSSSSELPSYTSAFSDVRSQQKVVDCFEESPSLTNFLKLSFSSGKDSTEKSEDFEEAELQSSDEEESFEEDDESIAKQNKSDRNVLNYIDPEGWIKYAFDPDPWNEKFYTETPKKFGIRDGILTSEDILERTSHLAQLPDTKAYVYSRLHIIKMDLRNISVLSNYRYFMYIDMSWNLISDLNELNNCNYLMYLNLSHNKISKVLDFKPPWFLTHVNLCCNEIKEIGTGKLSEFWSLRYLDLSYNLIEEIEGLQDLRYLKYLNLSHNFITEVENVQCTNLQELDLSFNKIKSCTEEKEGCLKELKDLRDLNLAHNFLTTLRHFENLTSLKKLDISHNNISDISEIYCIEGFKKLEDFNIAGNNICLTRGYREFLIFKLPILETVDSIPVNCQERVAAKMLWKPDVFTNKMQNRTKQEFWNQLATPTMDSATVPYDEPPIPLVVLVGTFGNNKNEIAKQLSLDFPDQVYRCQQVTTASAHIASRDSGLLPISVDDFNNMIKDGKLLFYYKETGHNFGVGVDQLCVCAEENKIGIIETTLDGALAIRSTGCRPFLVLCTLEDTNGYEKKLNSFFTDPDIWKSFFGLKLTTKIKKSSSLLEPCDETDEDLEYESLEYSNSKSTITGNYSLYSALPDNVTTKTMESTSTQSISKSSTFTGNCSVYSALPDAVTTNTVDSTQSIIYQSRSVTGSKVTGSKSATQSGTKSADVSQQYSTQTSSTTYKSQSTVKSKSTVKQSECCFSPNDDDGFVWEWTYEPSVVMEVEPSESYQNMQRGQETFVRTMLQQQSLCVQMNHNHPSLFTATVFSDDIDKAVRLVGKTCCEIYNRRGQLKRAETVLERPVCKQFIEARVQSLMKDLINVPTGV